MEFEKGDASRPRGHAVLYYRMGDTYLATYIMVLPLKLDFEKFIPPVLASQVKASGIEDVMAFAIPPMPDEVPDYDFLTRMAESRDDDLVFGGVVFSNDFLESAQRVTDTVKEYADLYQGAAEPVPQVGSGEEEISGLTVDEVLFSMMPEREALGELARRVGKMQFALEGQDERLATEAQMEIEALAKYLPVSYLVPRVLEAARLSVEQGPRLAQLYLERCYKLVDEDYAGVRETEDAIREMQGALE